MDIALRYTNVLKLLWYTGAISPFIPIGTPLSLIGLTIIFWVDKYLLLRRFHCPNQISFKLAKCYYKRLTIFLMFNQIGTFATLLLPSYD